MDIDEFKRTVQPRQKRSRLLPFTKQIRQLKADGYTDLQISEWLSKNNIAISREAVRKFIKRLPEESASSRKNETEAATASSTSASNVETQTSVRSGTSPADRMRQQLAEQKRQADSTLFKHDKTGKTD